MLLSEAVACKLFVACDRQQLVVVFVACDRQQLVVTDNS